MQTLPPVKDVSEALQQQQNLVCVKCFILDGRTGLIFESRKVQNHIQNASQYHKKKKRFLKEI